MDKELIQFVEWLPNNSEEFSGLTIEESITKINEMITSDEGKQTLEQLTNQYKGKEMGLFKKGGKLDYLLCLKKGGSVNCGCNKKQDGGELTQQDKASKSAQKISKPVEKAQGGTDGLGLTVQTPKFGDNLSYTNIISDGWTGKAATYITPNGKWQKTEYIMADNNSDVPGYANDFKLGIRRNPQTGELGDSLIFNKLLPGIYSPIGVPIKYSGDAETVRNSKKRK